MMLCETCMKKKLNKQGRFWWSLSGMALCQCEGCRKMKWTRPVVDPGHTLIKKA